MAFAPSPGSRFQTEIDLFRVVTAIMDIADIRNQEIALICWSYRGFWQGLKS
jgi:hypothetical protein